MIKKTLAVALACVGFAMAQPALADHDHGHDRGHDRHDHGRYDHHDRHRPPVHYYRPGPPHGGWARGQRLPVAYYQDRRYVVTDWRARQLYAPRPGYQWMQVDNQYMMVAIASGVIAGIILAH